MKKPPPPPGKPEKELELLKPDEKKFLRPAEKNFLELATHQQKPAGKELLKPVETEFLQLSSLKYGSLVVIDHKGEDLLRRVLEGSQSTYILVVGVHEKIEAMLKQYDADEFAMRFVILLPEEDHPNTLESFGQGHEICHLLIRTESGYQKPSFMLEKMRKHDLTFNNVAPISKFFEFFQLQSLDVVTLALAVKNYEIGKHAASCSKTVWIAPSCTPLFRKLAPAQPTM